jgi:hypothetical protein
LLNEALQIAEIQGEPERKTERGDREGTQKERQRGETERKN